MSCMLSGSAALVAGLLLVGSVRATELGAAATPLNIGTWIKGGPVDVTDGKQVYVVEFWATWCPPCRKSIPHLTEVQKKYRERGVTIVGISGEPLATVTNFLAGMGTQMDYVVACDSNNLSAAAYQKAFGIGGIPHAYIVGKDKRILWHGHPMAGLEGALDAILAGTYDLAKERTRLALRDRISDLARKSFGGDATVPELAAQILKDAGDDVELLCDLAMTVAGNPRNPKRAPALAEQALAQAAKSVGADHFRIVLVRSVLAFEGGKPEEGLALARKNAANAKTDADRAEGERIVQIMERRQKQAATPPAPQPAPARP